MSGFGGLIGGVIGAVIGSFAGPAGAMWGWTIGSMVGSALDPEKVEGPRLDDLKVQTSEYGRPIPIVYGHVGIAGNVIWAMDLIEESDTEGGGLFGGPEVTTYTYFANFAVAVAEGPVSFGRIWAGPEKRLIWDGTAVEGGTITFYSGSEDQTPDPLMESDLGAGNVPAYRGTAYVVFERFPLAKDGNRIPFLTFEVGNASSDVNTGPANTGVTWFTRVLQAGNKVFSFYVGAYDGVTIHTATGDTLNPLDFYRHYAGTTGAWGGVNGAAFLDPDRERIIFYPGYGRAFDTVDWTDGNRDTHDFTLPVGADSGTGMNIFGGCYQNGSYLFAANGSPTGTVSLYVVDPDTFACVAAYSVNSGTGTWPATLLQPQSLGGPDYSSSDMYVAWHDGTLTKHQIASGLPMTAIGTALSEFPSIDPFTNYIWSRSYDFGAGTLAWTVHDPDSGLIKSDSVPALFDADGGAFNFGPDNVLLFGERWLGVDYFQVFDPLSGDWVADVTGGYHGVSQINRLHYEPLSDTLMAFRYGGSITFGGRNDPAGTNLLVPGTYTPELDNLYHAERDVSGSVDVGPVALDVVVSDLCARAGLDAAQIDVTDLVDDDVDGYVIANTTAVKEAILALAPAYFFDGAEWDGKLHFVKRGGASVATIHDGELGASESGGEPAEPLTTARAMDDDLPRIVAVKYMQEATKYNYATRIAKRLVGESQNRQEPMDLPMVLSDTKAQEVAEVNLHGPWVARIGYQFTLPRKYSYLTPTDIIVVGGNTVRLTRIRKTADGRLQCEAVHDDANVYHPVVIVTETVPPEESVEAGTTTTLELL